MKQIIIHITLPDKFPTGGPRTLFDLVSNLDKNRYRSIVIYPSGKFSDQLSNYCQVSNHSIKKYPNIKNLCYLIKLLKQNSKAIIHFHHSNTLWLASIIKVIKRNKIIYTEHVLTKDYNPPNKMSYLIYTIKYAINIKAVDKIICVSKAVKSYIEKRFHIKNTKLAIIHNGIIIPKLTFSKKTNQDSTFNITCVGALNWVKNYSDLVEIINLLVNKYSTTNIQLTIFGDGPQRKNIESKIQEYNLHNNILLKGHVSLEEIHENLKFCDLYLQTSISESFGLGILDALSYGIPVLAYDVGAINELVTEKCGILIPFYPESQKRIDEFALAIKTILQDNKLRANFSRACIEKSNDYAFEKIIPQYIELINNILIPISK
ncbi:MAG TPA: glycosyltransferase family 4 protein [Candidatus Dojkabacteria bacterium]|nr:glycosyltransferase family 4 protein [Candidatus Dojkabacteria bacterium]HQF36401.1 glycosyltransferase family 4 protein [Candidatus Dojkabacteria bacterium]